MQVSETNKQFSVLFFIMQDFYWKPLSCDINFSLVFMGRGNVEKVEECSHGT